MRLDKFLWFVRMTKTRGLAQELIKEGHIRIDRRRVDRANVTVKQGDTIVFATDRVTRVIRVEALPVRRGPAAEARTCYSDIPVDGTPART